MIMVGEIRDVETAKISIEAALTGHLVLSTLHTNDAPSAADAPHEMGVEPFLTASAVSAVLAQRLMRKLCDELRRALHAERRGAARRPRRPGGARALPGRRFKRKVGCTRCGNTGYRGRIGVFQLLQMSDRRREPRRPRAHTRTRSRQVATREGMRTLWADGFEKVAAGLTSIEELGRVVS